MGINPKTHTHGFLNSQAAGSVVFTLTSFSNLNERSIDVRTAEPNQGATLITTHS